MTLASESGAAGGRVLGVITARGGSKGVPRKNVRLLGGKPLLAYTIEAARSARSLTRVILSTEDREIAELGAALGVAAPFLRPAELARDETPTLPVLQHALRRLEDGGEQYDAVCLLQPTNPFRPSAWIDECVARFFRFRPDSVVTVLPVPPEFNPHWVYFEDDSGGLKLSTGERDPIPRRQALPAAWHREGSVYVTSRECLMAKDSLFGDRFMGYRVRAERAVNIDTLDDWRRAEALLSG